MTQETMTVSEYLSLQEKCKKVNKYKNTRTKVGNFTFDSEAEANYYSELLMRERSKDPHEKVVEIIRQPKFILQENYKYRGEKVRELRYIADFAVKYADGREEVIDVKGHRTKEYLIKKKLLLFKFNHINFIEISP
jgi:hypothetical protein